MELRLTDKQNDVPTQKHNDEPTDEWTRTTDHLTTSGSSISVLRKQAMQQGWGFSLRSCLTLSCDAIAQNMALESCHWQCPANKYYFANWRAHPVMLNQGEFGVNISYASPYTTVTKKMDSQISTMTMPVLACSSQSKGSLL